MPSVFMPCLVVRSVILIAVLASVLGGRSLILNNAESDVEHVVKPGETLSGISLSRGVPVDRLIALNELADPNALTAGQVLKLQPPTREYVARPGDTLSGVALAHGITLQELIDANRIANPDQLAPGHRLVIPLGASRAERPPLAQNPAQNPAPAADPVTVLLERLAEQYGVAPALAKAMAWPQGKPLPLDHPRALGLLQVSPGTFEHVQQAIVRRALDRTRPEDNAEAGLAYVGSLLRWAGDKGEPFALAAFIQGPGSVRANGVLPATDQQVKGLLALRDRLDRPGRPSTAAPTPTLEPATMLAAQALANARGVAGQEGRIGVAGYDLVSGQRLAIAADETFPAASVGKLAVLVEAYRQHEDGRRPLADGTAADLKRMIALSDNAAANRLIDQLGIRTINQAMVALGLVRTRLNNPFATGRPESALLNQTSPADMARFLELLAKDQLVSPAASRAMRDLLSQAGDDSKLRRGLPPGVTLAHKSGWFAGVANDVGIVHHGRSAYVLAVFTEGIPDGRDDAAIAAIARTVHEAWGKR